MDIPLNANVYSTEHSVGRSICLLVNPFNKTITHFVLERHALFGYQQLVPVTLIKVTTADMILLNCTTAELADLDPFVKSEFIDFRGTSSDFGAGMVGAMVAWPYLIDRNPASAMINIEQIPADELGIHRGAHVDATDGYVGQVDEFVVNPENFHITHLVLRAGPLWGQKDVRIPVSALLRIEGDGVYLKLDKAAVNGLPHVRRH